ncbi:MAG TPA: response regulator [Geminicoccus sp.]|uniref:response regulator n=1 Tax=Geminicoccus sp. TaxID=2024832 RepID=UPI002E3671C7|nr:response regulator [Geminicoccus sp.]HEX2527965.1 response regulator [Geminicoccus sp.]
MVILVAEDEGLIAFALEWALRLAGHHVLGPVDNVASALDLIERTKPDMALIDLDLKAGDDGAQIARCLHDRYRTPVLFTSARLAKARQNRHVAWGLIPKPYDPDQVLDVVSFIGDVARGSTPPRVPHQVELFQPIG